MTPAARDGRGSFTDLRVGFGFAIRIFKDGVPLLLGGAAIDHHAGLHGERDDGDAVCQAVLSALLSACGLPEIAILFPTDDPLPPGMDSLSLLTETATGLLHKRISTLLNVSVQVETSIEAITSERKRMIHLVAGALQIEQERVNITFGTGGQLPSVAGDGAVAAFANVLCVVEDVPAKPRKERTKPTTPLPLETQPGKDQPTDETQDDALLPERARHFERAVKSKLPPLPPAPKPEPGASLIAYTDGACRGNPGPSSTGWVVLDAQGRLVGEGGSKIGEHTNNQAEYLAVKEVAAWIEGSLGREFNVEVRTDSLLLANQLSGTWKIKDAGLKQLAMEVMNRLMYFSSFNLKHVPRGENKRADALANRALDEK